MTCMDFSRVMGYYFLPDIVWKYAADDPKLLIISEFNVKILADG